MLATTKQGRICDPPLPIEKEETRVSALPLPPPGVPLGGPPRLLRNHALRPHRQQESLHNKRGRRLQLGPANPHPLAQQHLQQVSRPRSVPAVVPPQTGL